MLLHTPAYLVFLAGVVVIYWVIPGRRQRRYWLLAASYGFYLAFDFRFAGLLLGLTVANYWLGKAIARSAQPRAYVWLGVAVNLGVLGVFKYADFFLSAAQAALRVVGVSSAPASLRLLLPVGISFYTFQGISYIMEIYRHKAEPAASFLDFAVYLAFFPKLIAGPLVRPQGFLSQLAEPAKPPRGEARTQALELLLLGLFKKLVIADSLAALAETAFRAADAPPGGTAFATPLYLQGFYLYAFQIYADFSGYTDIARASAALLGFTLPENFRQPYLATTMGDFWNRWHMSLTQWFREYLFFPMSRALLTRWDRRYSPWAQLIANLATMTLIGLWHGAAWTFVAWGAWHGVLLAMERLFAFRPAGRWWQAASSVLTFHLVGAGWILFRASSFAGAARFLAGLVSFEQMAWLGYYLPSILVAGGLVFAIDLVAAGRMPALGQVTQAGKTVLVVACVFVLAGLALLGFVRGTDARPFIYGQF